MKAICVSASASNQGKTVLTTALLYHFRNSVRPFKMGPDFIDPQFHKIVCQTPSINLDRYMMNKKQLQWLFNHYSDKEVSVCEGVMGFYDGHDKKSSAYDITKLLNIPTIILLDGSGSYITVSAVLKGLKSYKKDNTIKAVVLNKIASQGHYELIKKIIEKDFKDIKVLGWIKSGIESLSDTHLGLDLKDLNKIEKISHEVLEHIDIKKLEKISKIKKKKNIKYPFKKIDKIDKKLALVYDKNFSFLYYDNLQFLKEIFREVVIVDSTKDEIIPENTDVVYICGGYVETDEAYNRVKNSNKFRNSLINHAKDKTIYAECAGLLYLGNKVDEKDMSSILDVSFVKEKRFQRMGYYFNEDGIKGHAFHYTKPTDENSGFDRLSKSQELIGKFGSWEKNRVFGTFLHCMLRGNIKLIKRRLLA
ncbi:cobyrinate a,c-diamide synthase [Arcobacter sp.]|uniref:cobyrinate a,c-diamide synthase n=1 Tax=Arcobacter sp. TaxID=1872629 RepID=UPI003D0D7BEB